MELISYVHNQRGKEKQNWSTILTLHKSLSFFLYADATLEKCFCVRQREKGAPFLRPTRASFAHSASVHTNKILRYCGQTGDLERVTKSNTILEFEQPRIYEHHDISTITNLWHQYFAHAFPAPVLFHQQTYLHQKLRLSMAEATSTGDLKKDHNWIFQLLLRRPYVDRQNWNQNINYMHCIHQLGKHK